jgi:hypothetical protein
MAVVIAPKGTDPHGHCHVAGADGIDDCAMKIDCVLRDIDPVYSGSPECVGIKAP